MSNGKLKINKENGFWGFSSFLAIMMLPIIILFFMIFLVTTISEKNSRLTDVRVGEVIKISVSNSSLVQSKGAWFGNESVKIEEINPIFEVLTEDKEILSFSIVSVFSEDLRYFCKGVKVGDKLSFATKKGGRSVFRHGRYGRVPLKGVKIL